MYISHTNTNTMEKIETKKYDLTTVKGFNTTINLLKKYGWILNPIPWLIYKALSPEITTEKQIEAAKTLIESGQKNGVKRMRIKIGHKAGINIASMFQGLPIKLMMGNDGMSEIEVDYSDNNFNSTSEGLART